MRSDPGIPLFFKLWFAFVALLAVSTIGLAIFTVVYVAADPAVLGRIAGEVVSGFHEATK